MRLVAGLADDFPHLFADLLAQAFDLPFRRGRPLHRKLVLEAGDLLQGVGELMDGFGFFVLRTLQGRLQRGHLLLEARYLSQGLGEQVVVLGRSRTARGEEQHGKPPHAVDSSQARPARSGTVSAAMAAALSDVDLLGRLVGFDTVSPKSNLPLADFLAEYAGPEATVENQRAAFEGLVASLKRGGSL